jgi:phosphohistidine phosphatase
MKTLFLVRHAKSAGQYSAPTDFERPLNEQGIRTAPLMARYLLKKKIPIDQFVSSPALRAKSTAQLFMKEYQRDQQELLLIQELYHASTELFTEIVSRLDDRFDQVALFSHNPGITDFASSLTAVKIDNMPTSSVFGITVPIERWKDFAAAPKSFLLFEYPKNLDATGSPR